MLVSNIAVRHGNQGPAQGGVCRNASGTNQSRGGNSASSCCKGSRDNEARMKELWMAPRASRHASKLRPPETGQHYQRMLEAWRIKGFLDVPPHLSLVSRKKVCRKPIFSTVDGEMGSAQRVWKVPPLDGQTVNNGLSLAYAIGDDSEA
ncbi:hypothetical protein G7046_g6039 [Stylonectria norvegica]|nr:hypothetical protein G7046_g6039 [Stylonectria norvegica]